MTLLDKKVMIRVWYDEFQMKQDKVTWFSAMYHFPYKNAKYGAPLRPCKIEVEVEPSDLELFKEFTDPYSWWLPKIHPNNKIGFYLNGEKYA